MKVLYVTDLDGTLLNNKAELSEYTVTTINGLIDKGMFFTYASARSLVSASGVIKGLKTNIPVITKNGIFIENAHTKEKIYSLFFSHEEKYLLMDILEKYSVYPLVYGFIDGIEKKSWLKDKENEGVKSELGSWKDDPRYRPVNSINDLYLGDIFHINCIGKREDLKDVYKYLTEMEYFNCLLEKEYYSDHYWCQILPKKATKGNTVQVLKELYKYDKIISFGDGINDIPMFKISDESYAVENAADELKNIATDVIMSNENNGVAQWLEKNYNT